MGRVVDSPSENQAQQARRRWPMWRVAVVVIALLVIGEQFPFSYFPMYSSFDPVADYYYVTNATGEPLASVSVFGTSTANVKKMYRARLRALVALRGVGENEASEAESRQAGEAMLAYLRQLGAKHGIGAPTGRVRLMRVRLSRSPENEISRNEVLIAEQ